ncbi:YbaK/EbsC family protein, partial [Klebsiella pneumoniae]|uniref:YbaK/EbsC family protein n=1 Tax=Klebsiella pneumoniae TaxID=573 RepID=UPI002B4B9EB3
MLEAVEGNIHQRLCALLDEHRARYRVMAHDAVGQCEAVSAIRGTALGQGAKALVCKVKGNGVNQHVLAILAADRQADLASLARHIGGSKASLASPALKAICGKRSNSSGSATSRSAGWKLKGGMAPNTQAVRASTS